MKLVFLTLVERENLFYGINSTIYLENYLAQYNKYCKTKLLIYIVHCSA